MIDLIDESGEDLTAFGYETVKLPKFGITSSKLCVDSSVRARKLGFDKGNYFILNAPLLSNMMQEHYGILVDEMRQRLSFLLKENKVKKSDKILLVGIGNPAIVADSFGVKTAEKIEIKPYKKNNRTFKLLPNVFANTGLNAYDIIRLVVEAFDVGAVFLFDSLATSSLTRLGTSLQFNDAGLTPGSAMNNFGVAINRASLHVPCICVGVPMMISSKVFGENLEVVLTEKDAKEKIEFLSSLVAEVVSSLL